jgi:phosphoribosylamine--glycine ligase
MTTGSGPVLTVHPGYSLGVVLTTPPFPYTRKEVAGPIGLPVSFQGELSQAGRQNIHYGEVGLAGNRLVTTGLYGWSMVVTGTAATIVGAQAEAYARARRIIIPNMRYRDDIGKRLIATEHSAPGRDGHAWRRSGELECRSRSTHVIADRAIVGL